MGLEAVSEGKGTYLKLFRGYLTQKPDPMIPGQKLHDFTIEMQGKKQTFTKAISTAVTGFITGVAIKDGKFGKVLEVHLMDGPDSFVLQMRPDSSEAFDFYGHMMAVDYSKEVRFFHWQKEKQKGTNYWSLGMTQLGESGDWEYCGYSWPKDTVPAWEKNPLGGRNVDKALFFYMAELEKLQKQLGANGNTAKAAVVDEEKMLDDDGLPF